MKCPGTGLIQAYIDGELEIGVKKEMENHLSTCGRCAEKYEELKQNDDFIFEKVKYYNEIMDENPAHTRPVNSMKPQAGVLMKTKGVYYLMRKYRKSIAVACLCLALVLCTVVQPVRAAISSALSIFRVENVKGISISLEDIRQIQDKLLKNEPDISIDKVGRIKMQGGQEKSITADDLKAIADIDVRIPAAFSGITPDVTNIEPSQIEFTLDADNVNSIMKSFGAKELLPDSIDGKTFTARFSRQLILKYAKDGNIYKVIETRAPQLEVPSGVDVDEIYEALLELPILPSKLQSQLKSIKDWKNTVYIPVVDKVSEEIDLDGTKAFLFSTDDPRETLVKAAVVWYDNGMIYVVQSDSDRDSVVDAARTMR